MVLNFRLPYFASDPSDFWRRWHISLSTWLRDYVYLPLGGSRFGKIVTVRNLMLTMLLGGLWHGAAWHYVAWGAYHGALLTAFHVSAPVRSRLPAIPTAVFIALMFVLTLMGWVLFRADSLSQAIYMVSNIGMDRSPASLPTLRAIALYVSPLLAMEMLHLYGREEDRSAPHWHSYSKPCVCRGNLHRDGVRCSRCN